METFYEEMMRVISGRFSFRDGIQLAVDKPRQKLSFLASEYHEWIHIELTDNSAYGFFQKSLNYYIQTPTLDREFRDKCSYVLRNSMDGCTLVHEGLASYRALVWYCARQGAAQGEAYLRSLPAKYQEGVQMVVQLLGNPIESPFDLLESVAIHFMCGCIGTAALNSRIVEFYSDFNNINHEELPYIRTNTPDHRFQRIVEASDLIRPIIDWLTVSALEIAIQSLPHQEADPKYLALRDEWLAAMNNLFVDMEILNTESWYPHAHLLLTMWSPHLEKLGQKFVLGEFGKFVSEESVLSVKFSRLNEGPHQGNDLEYYPFSEITEFIHYLHLNTSKKVFWLLIFAFYDTEAYKDIGQRKIATLAAPMLNHTPSNYSPLAAPKGFKSLASLRDWQVYSHKVTEAGGVWYADGSYFRLFEDNHYRFRGFVISKWENMKKLHDVIDLCRENNVEIHYGLYQWNDFLMAAIISKNTFDFCVATLSQRQMFLEKLEILNFKRAKNYNVHIGQAEVSAETIARVALWAFVGY
jgi:hypothetical protein